MLSPHPFINHPAAHRYHINRPDPTAPNDPLPFLLLCLAVIAACFLSLA